ncbi:MAG: hypothetical protein ICV66_00330 [Chitinophagaceae bacterium]|nr:hypothetical protein [Chitinophagaceae bacterium]
MKKIFVIIIVIGVIILSGYVYLRVKLNSSGKKVSIHSNIRSNNEAHKPETFLDLRLRLIEKLQQLVKSGSNGLYNLTIGTIDADVLSSELNISSCALVPDNEVLAQLTRQKKAPDELFRIKFNSLRINGIGIKDLLTKDILDLTSAVVTNPVIEVFFQNQGYSTTDTLTLYQRLMKNMKRIKVGKVMMRNGLLFVHQNSSKKVTRFRNVEISMHHILIDSTTQYDKSRFLFAKQAELSFNNFLLPTPDNLYWFKAE